MNEPKRDRTATPEDPHVQMLVRVAKRQAVAAQLLLQDPALRIPGTPSEQYAHAVRLVCASELSFELDVRLSRLLEAIKAR
jgi:hypothetical protein